MKAHDRHRTHLWPSPEQGLLLKAALLDGEAALGPFRAWRRGVDLDADLGYPILKLLPLVHQNLLRLGCDDPLMGRLRGVYRRFWCEGQTLFFALTPVLERLATAGVDLLLLKGAPLVLSYYGNPALRPMADLDIAVPHDRLIQAIDLLKGDGWQVENPPGPDTLRYFHAARCTKGRLELDIHYHFLRECVSRGADRWFWSDVEPVRIQGIDALQLGPTALLFHTIVHGVRWNLEPPIRWIPDAVQVLRRRGGEIDWERLLRFAAGERVTQRLALGLGYLEEQLGIGPPAGVRERLARFRPGLKERITNTVVLGDSERIYGHPLGKQWAMFADYCALDRHGDPLRLAWGFSHYLRYRWQLPGRLALIPAILGGGLRRLARPR